MVRVIAGVIFVFLISFTPVVQAGDEQSAKGVVERLQSGVIDVLKNAKALGVEGRYRGLLPVLQSNVHMTLMTATASGAFWRKGTKPQRERASKAFAEMHTALLASLFDSNGGETFRTQKVRETGGKVVLVDSEIFDNDGEPTLVTFVTANIGTRWWVIDVVIAGGISEVKVKKNEFHRTLTERGLDGLSETLEQKKRRLLAGEEKAKR
ncbi:MAG: ABC transporter substrate-binding protein [Proteobacteria bacterium]|nr:ABC transporter substrate-binding protein [Pseudomonadota bacterium]